MIADPLSRLRALRLLGPALDGQTPALDDRTWRALTSIATEHGLAPALWVSVRAVKLPEDVRKALRAAYHRNLGRSLLVRDGIRSTLLALNAQRILPSPLKGALHLLEGTFSHPAARVLADIDLLITASELGRAVSALEEIGYRRGQSSRFVEHHEVPMLTELGVVVELHRDLGPPAITGVLPAAEYLARSCVVEHEGLRYRSPTPTNVVLHNVLHAQVADRNHFVFGLPLRQLHTLSMFLRRRAGDVEWSDVIRVMDGHRSLPVLAGYLDLARTVFGSSFDLPIELPSPRWRRQFCLVNGALKWQAGDLVRNLESAFASDYLHARYGDGSRPRLWAAHVRNSWSERGSATIKEATATSRWR
ncbi:MAG: nucleotidyltransferase family protein [Acidimicrobiales bacterium]